ASVGQHQPDPRRAVRWAARGMHSFSQAIRRMIMVPTDRGVFDVMAGGQKLLCASVALLAINALSATPALAADPEPDPDRVVTFSKDVMPILQQNCQVCHQPGAIGPMSLMNYEEVRPWAQVIKQRVIEREMPP